MIGAKRTTITVHRSEEVLPVEAPKHLKHQAHSLTEGELAVTPPVKEKEFGPLDPVEHTLPEGEK